MAERIRRNIIKRLLRIQGKDVAITASFGVVGFHPDTPESLISMENLINQADKHLYRAKQEGRNLVKGDELREQLVQ